VTVPAARSPDAGHELHTGCYVAAQGTVDQQLCHAECLLRLPLLRL
jgi:hypothetical protein